MQRVTFFTALAVLIALTAPAYVQAQAPPNDDLANAIEVTSFPFLHTVATPDSATVELNENVCNPGDGTFRDSW